MENHPTGRMLHCAYRLHALLLGVYHPSRELLLDLAKSVLLQRYYSLRPTIRDCVTLEQLSILIGFWAYIHKGKIIDTGSIIQDFALDVRKGLQTVRQLKRRKLLYDVTPNARKANLVLSVTANEIMIEMSVQNDPLFILLYDYL